MLRRLILILVIGGALLLLWSNLETPPPSSTPFLGVAKLGERVVVVRSKEPVPGRSPRFVLENLDGSDPVERMGEPRVATTLKDGILVLFDDAGARIVPPEDGETGPDWSPVGYPKGDFRPLAAVADPEGSVLILGRLAEKPDAVVWGRLANGEIRLEEERLSIGPAAADVQMLLAASGPRVLWRESTLDDITVYSLAVPPVEGASRRREAYEIRGLETFVATADGDAIQVLALESAGRLAVRDGVRSDTIDLEGLASVENVRLAVSGNELLALSRGRVIRWPLDEAGRPVGDRPSRVLQPPDFRGWALALAAFAGMTITVLILRPGRVAPGLAVAIEPAPPAPRLAACLLDIALVLPLALVAVATSLDVELGPLFDALLAGEVPERSQVVLLVVELVALVYFVAAEAIFGWTLGKRALGLRVVGLDGGRAGFAAIVLRNLLRVLVDLYGGAILILVTRNRQRVGDWAARTLVVRQGASARPETSDSPSVE